MGKHRERARHQGVRFIQPRELQDRYSPGIRLPRDPQRVRRKAEELIEAARRALPGLKRRLQEAKEKSSKLLVIASRRFGRIKGHQSTSDIPDLGSVECILTLEADIEACEELIQNGVPELDDMDRTR